MFEGQGLVERSTLPAVAAWFRDVARRANGAPQSLFGPATPFLPLRGRDGVAAFY